MKILPLPIQMRAQIVEEELKALIPSSIHDRLETYLCLLELWEDFTREQALEHLWAHRENLSHLFIEEDAV